MGAWFNKIVGNSYFEFLDFTYGAFFWDMISTARIRNQSPACKTTVSLLPAAPPEKIFSQLFFLSFFLGSQSILRIVL